ncbi:hypothetical protein BDQ94DRAFT_170147 [Aspergillus welwitschiae]|uniref:Hydrophobin n=1 Tax=Aspergillus welwitschiae TaxID=1341132 RepID=A0A3F3Q2S3_9EURO|nr:hypothetical protein BDQ94DRAFT_170147 [Aspergillus welwitschiae]RDH33524.1 hypothetical protein BDQ94DRAFT_170147 [Aspergillus welwitschiae]
MKFTAAAALALATVVVAQPSVRGRSVTHIPAPAGMTVSQGADSCGDNAQLSCCNKATYAGDTTDIDSGFLSGVLSNLLGAGSGSQGIGLADECSPLDLQALNIVGLQNLLNDQCEQTAACCQGSGSDTEGNLIGVGLPCLALGSLL